MFAATVLRLHLEEPAYLPADLGRSTHGCFFKLLEDSAPELATALHDQDTGRPKGFTVSNLLGPRTSRTGDRSQPAPPSPAGQPFIMRITSIDARVSEALLERVVPRLSSGLQIPVGDHTFVADECLIDEAAHPLAGTVAPTDLAKRYLFDLPTPGNLVNLQFHSTTLFHSEGRSIPFPLPEFVFGGYLDRWNSHVPTELCNGRDLRRFVQEHVSVGRYDLRSAQVRLEFGAPLIGFVGSCQFRIVSRDNYWLRLLHLLGVFSFWCGTGYKTTMGLGQTRLLADSHSQRQSRGIARA